MRRLEFSNPWQAAIVAVLLLVPVAGVGQQGLTHGPDGWVRTYTASVTAAPRLYIEGHGPVTLERAASGRAITYTVRIAINARTEAEARRLLDRIPVQIMTEPGKVALILPGGRAFTTVEVKVPTQVAAEVTTTEGLVSATDIDGALTVDSRAGEIAADRIHGECQLSTGGGKVTVGDVDSNLKCTTAAGAISVHSCRGEAVLVTNGGDVTAGQMGGSVVAQTGGGGIHVVSAAGAVTAINGGGEIIVDKAGGLVLARNLLGPVTVTGANGVHCENATGGVRLNDVSGSVRVSTASGSIYASLLGRNLLESLLATGNGDITVLIPSNLGVRLRIQNDTADSMLRIRSEYPGLTPRRQGASLVAEGAVNGGGPLLQISGAGGTIYVRRQR